ncbi:MAG TPA: hypothetical protein VE968_08820, partial [Sphingomicrobium sp.]|nr:hypothetical protein [Sphingomicrobium sp.]
SARGDEERIRAAGAQAYVSKPISVVRFAQTVDDLLSGHRDTNGNLGTNEREKPESSAISRGAANPDEGDASRK